MAPQLGATFVPGGFDDYYMPEVIAPAPQRIMPEVPQNMQDDIQRMELEAREREQPKRNGQPNSSSRPQSGAGEPKSFKPFHSNSNTAAAMEAPASSPFPKVKGDNVPPSDDEKEQILWQARNLVLHSNDVPMQVTWARDTLIWVEIAQDAAARERKREGRTGERPTTPRIEHQLRVDAVNILDHLSNQAHPEATFMKGKWYEFGKFGFRENKRDAYSLYKKAAENGYGRAEYRMGMLYENSSDANNPDNIPNAIKHYKLGVALDDSASNYRLGMMHLMGQHGFPRDLLQGLEMIQRAADTADEDAPQGAYVYGMLIARELPDIDIPEDILPCELGSARQYIEKAAYLSFAKAQLKMGQAYELSQLGCDFNPAYSLHYYSLAAHQGQPEAALGVSRWFLFGYDGLFPKNEQLAFKYAQDAAASGLATGEFAMGYYHEIGIHVPKSISEARKWYELAAQHGNKDAQGRLDSLSQSKTLTKQDHETTTLTRIKSQHGSQRGRRPDRFARQNDVLPTLSEGDPNGPGRSPPRAGAGGVAFPDPSLGGSRPPAFTVNLDTSNLAVRPKSAAPYPPEGMQPLPLNARPQSVAPYPMDDGPQSGMRLSAVPNRVPVGGPHADRPGSAFGIRPLSPMDGNQVPNRRPVSSQPAVGPWDPQQPPQGYGQRRPSPGPGGPPQWNSPADVGAGKPQPNRMGPGGPVPGIVPAGTMPPADGRGRLQKNNPKVLPPAPQQPGQYPGGGYGQPNAGSGPGRDYGSGGYDRYGAVPPASRPPAGGANNLQPHFQRVSTTPEGGRMPSGGGPGLGIMEGSGGRSSAPPSNSSGRQSGRPTSGGPGPNPSGRPISGPGPNPNGRPTSGGPTGGRPTSGGPTGGRPPPPASANSHPDGKTMGQGPATFEAMGIPQGKTESDCIVM